MVEEIQGGGTVDQVMQRLLSESAPNPIHALGNTTELEPILAVAANDIASSSVPMVDNVGEDEGDDGPSTEGKVEEERDIEMEDELADGLAKVDAMSDYDIEVTKEGEAINEYLALLDSAGKS